MASHIDNAMIKCIGRRGLLPQYEAPDKKVAVIGENSTRVHKTSLTWKLIDKFWLKRRNIEIFTASNKFKSEDAERFDVLIGTRPCLGEMEILIGAAKYNKKFILMPCTCGNLQIKVVQLIRQYPVIKKIEAEPEQHDDGTKFSYAWMILYN